MADELAEWNRTLEQRVEEQVGAARAARAPQALLLAAARRADRRRAAPRIRSRRHRREVTVVFLDLRGFTAFAETAEPEEVMGVLREYHAEMGELILAHEGTLERFTGDGMMIFFNDPVPVPDPRSARSGWRWRCASASPSWPRSWRKRGLRARPRRRHRPGLRHHRRHRLRGALGLRRHRHRHQPRRAALRRGQGRPDPRVVPRGGGRRRAGRPRGGRAADAEGLPQARPGVQPPPPQVTGRLGPTPVA